MWHRVVDRVVVAAHRNPANVVHHRAPPLPPPLPSRRSPARSPDRSAVLSPPSLAPCRPLGRRRGEGARARACQGQLTSVTFSAIHWLFADSGGAMMDCPARAGERPRRPREGGAGASPWRIDTRRRHAAAATSERYVPHQEKLENHHSIGGSRRRRKGRAAESAPKHVARTKDGR